MNKKDTKTKVIEISALAFNRVFFEFRKEARAFLVKKHINNLHFDVMNKTFVNNLAFPNLEHLDFLLKLKYKISVHLMVEDVDKYIEKLCRKKVKAAAFHCETQDIAKALDYIKELKDGKVKAGVALKPDTDYTQYKELFDVVDYVLVMSVQPGFGGQTYIEESTQRVKDIRAYIPKHVAIHLDGGVGEREMLLNKDYVDTFVSGTYLYKNDHKYEYLLEKISS